MSDEKVSEALSKFLESINENGQMVMDNIPAVLNDLLFWHFYTALGTQLLSVLFLVVCFFVFKKIVKDFENKEEWIRDISRELRTHKPEITMKAFVILISMLAGSVISIILIITNFEWVKILFAPNLYLLEYALQLGGS